MYFSTSWDDNCTENEILANLLSKFNIPSTFYLDQPRINRSLVKEISKDFDIGAHTLNHPYLSKLNIQEQKKEIKESKDQLEELCQLSVKLFAYPYGDYNDDSVSIVEDCGFEFARTTKSHEFNFTKVEKYKMPVSIIFSPTKFERDKTLKSFFNVYKNRRNLSKRFSIPIYNIPYCSKTIIDIINNNSEDIDYFHLWGHAWQIEKFNYWSSLKRLFQIIKSNKNIIPINNYELFHIFNKS